MSKKKRSVKGKIRLGLFILLVLSFLCLIILSFIRLFRRTEKPIYTEGNMDVSDLVTDELEDDPIDIIDEQEVYNGSATETKVPEVTLDYTKEYEIIDEIFSLVKNVSYTDIANIGLIHIIQTIYNNNEDVNLFKEYDIHGFIEVEEKSLVIGDIGISKIGDKFIYGVYVGDYGSNKLFAYASDLPFYPDLVPGTVYLSYNKNTCNDLFAGMVPIAYERFVRMPDVQFKALTEGIESIPAHIVPKQLYAQYSEVLYRLSEWRKGNQVDNLIKLMNHSYLQEKGYTIDESVYNGYIEEFLIDEDYCFKLYSYKVFEDFSTVQARIVALGVNQKQFYETDDYIEFTIFNDGTYLPGSVYALDKYSMIYGYTKIEIEDGQIEDQEILTEVEHTEDSSIDDIATEDDDWIYESGVLNEDMGLIYNIDIIDSNPVISGNGYKINLKEVYDKAYK